MDPCQDDDRAKRDERRRQIRPTMNHPCLLSLLFLFDISVLINDIVSILDVNDNVEKNVYQILIPRCPTYM